MSVRDLCKLQLHNSRGDLLIASSSRSEGCRYRLQPASLGHRLQSAVSRPAASIHLPRNQPRNLLRNLLGNLLRNLPRNLLRNLPKNLLRSTRLEQKLQTSLLWVRARVFIQMLVPLFSVLDSGAPHALWSFFGLFSVGAEMCVEMYKCSDVC